MQAGSAEACDDVGLGIAGEVSRAHEHLAVDRDRRSRDAGGALLPRGLAGHGRREARVRSIRTAIGTALGCSGLLGVGDAFVVASNGGVLRRLVRDNALPEWNGIGRVN